jgi:predicted nuclease of predicted toxin-antitoxin system
VPRASIRVLRSLGFDVRAIIDERRGSADADVLELAAREQRLLLTFDKDFGELIYRRGAAPPAGVVFMRFAPSDPEEAATVLVGLLEIEGLQLEGSFTVVSRDLIRQRPLPA